MVNFVKECQVGIFHADTTCVVLTRKYKWSLGVCRVFGFQDIVVVRMTGLRQATAEEDELDYKTSWMTQDQKITGLNGDKR